MIVPAHEAPPVTLALLYALSDVDVPGATHTPDGTVHHVVVSASVISKNDDGAVNLWTTRPMTSLGYWFSKVSTTFFASKSFVKSEAITLNTKIPEHPISWSGFFSVTPAKRRRPAFVPFEYAVPRFAVNVIVFAV